MIEPRWGNIQNWFSGNIRERERLELRESWAQTERLWQASPFNTSTLADLVKGIVRSAMAKAKREPALPILVAVCVMVDGLFRAEEIIALEAEWPLIESDPAVAVEIRKLLARRRRWCGDFNHMHSIFAGRLITTLVELFDSLPEACFGDWEADDEFFGVPLVDLVEWPAAFVQSLCLIPYDDDAFKFEVFTRMRERMVTRLLLASGLSPEANVFENQSRLVMPTLQKGKSASELATLYLTDTPFLALAQFMVPFHIPAESRFEHCHIVGGTGHGKTQLMQRMIHTDILAARYEKRSVVVIDSQGDLINKLVRLAVFDPAASYSLAHRLMIIDPADVEFPFSLNLFDSHLDRIKDYSAADRERVLNGVIELYEVFFTSMLGAELTQKQGVIFRYLARLMMTIPDATIYTLMQIMEDGKPFKSHMDRLEGSARHFFATEFFHPSFSATKKQILKRLWGVLSTPAFERMFAQKDNKLDLFEALNDGTIILISTAKDLLKNDGSALLGRFLIAMLSQVALERSTLAPDKRTPTFVYVDEAQEYFDDSIESILSQARKYRVGLTLAHQTLDQLTPRLRASILSNTSFKCVGGVSNRDAHALAGELRTDADFIESMRRHKTRSEFAVWLKHETPRAIRLSVPLGFLEREAIMDEEAFAQVIAKNRSRYCCPLDQLPLMGFSTQGPEVETEPPVTVPPPPVEPAPERHAPPARLEPEEPAPRETQADIPVRPAPAKRKPASPIAERELGKGGPQHRYVQHLIKGLAEERGFRAVIEAPVEGGQVDVGLYRDGLAIACEISVTSTASYEAQNLAKCVAGGFTYVFAIGSDAKRLRTIENAAKAVLSVDDIAKVSFLTPYAVAAALDSLSLPPAEETVVRGYRVKVSKTVVSASEAQDRRASVARVIAQSLRNLPNT